MFLLAPRLSSSDGNLFASVLSTHPAHWKPPPEAKTLFFMKIPATRQGALNAVLMPSIGKWLSVLGNPIGVFYSLWVGGCPAAKLDRRAAFICIVN